MVVAPLAGAMPDCTISFMRQQSLQERQSERYPLVFAALIIRICKQNLNIGSAHRDLKTVRYGTAISKLLNTTSVSCVVLADATSAIPCSGLSSGGVALAEGIFPWS